jgi:hypothetical protein
MSTKAGIIQLFYYIIGAGEDRRRIVRFNALAVLTFTVNSNLVGKLTGKLTGFSPLRILLT